MAQSSSRPHLGRGVLATCVPAVVGAMTSPSVPVRATDASDAAFAHAITELAEIVLCAASWWLAAATALLVTGSLRGAASLPARLGLLVTPPPWRRLLTVVLGGAIVLSPVATGAATPGGGQPHVAGLPLPDRPSAGLPANADRIGRTDTKVVRVRPGDTLWDIASTYVPPGADNASRAAACDRWYAANREVIGADPDLLLPGTRLQVPPEPHERTSR